MWLLGRWAGDTAWGSSPCPHHSFPSILSQTYGKMWGTPGTAVRSIRPYQSSEQYLYAMKEDLAEWLKELYNLDIEVGTFVEVLETGAVLCSHANNVTHVAGEFARAFPAVARHLRLPAAGVTCNLAAQPGTFQARDNVSNFIQWCRKEMDIKGRMLGSSCPVCDSPPAAPGIAPGAFPRVPQSWCHPSAGAQRQAAPLTQEIPQLGLLAQAPPGLAAAWQGAGTRRAGLLGCKYALGGGMDGEGLVLQPGPAVRRRRHREGSWL